MADWRSNPRTGKSQFYHVQSEVMERRQRGETLRQIHEDLTIRELITFGYDQFIKYVRKATATPPAHQAAILPAVVPHPLAALQPPQAPLRRDNDESLHSSLPDRSRIYGK